MRKINCLTLSMILLSLSVTTAQEFTLDSLVSRIPVKYAVPDLPAFNALGNEPADLLRPSTAKDISITANEFYDGKNIIIPKTFAVEFSPVKLIKGNRLTLQDYQKSAAWYNSRISLGTFRDSFNISKMAIGFRTTLIDKGDPKSEKNLQNIFNVLKDKNKFRNFYLSYAVRQWAGEHPGVDVASLADSLYQVINAEFDSLLISKSDKLTEIRNLYEADNLEPVIEKFENNSQWNAERLDIAIAAVCASPDSLAKNLKFDAFCAWITYAMPIGEKGQFLLGANAGSNMLNDNFYWNVSVPVRIYIGSNDLKGLAEIQYLYKQQYNDNKLFARLGCEYRLHGNIWLNFTAGIQRNFTDNSSDLVSDFKIIYGI